MTSFLSIESLNDSLSTVFCCR